MHTKFKTWINTPKVLIPYIKHKMEKRDFRNENLREDYNDAMEELIKIISSEKFTNVAHRKVMRHYEITRDHMESLARKKHDYMKELDRTNCLNDFYSFVSVLEDMSRERIPNLEVLL